MNVNNIVTCAVALLALQSGVNALDSKVQVVSQLSLNNFALISHSLQGTACFEKTSSGFIWLDDCDYANKTWCPTAWQHFKSMEAAYVSGASCEELETDIIRNHVDLALHQKLPSMSSYGGHLIYQCNEKECFSTGNLAGLNSETSEKRVELASKDITICTFTTIRANSMGILRYLSSTIFGKIPQNVKDICQYTFEDNINDLKSQEQLSKVYIVSQLSLFDFARISHALQEPVCFKKTSSGFVWINDCDDPNMNRCITAWQSSMGSQHAYVGGSSCEELETNIIRSHVDLALQQKLSSKSSYGGHLTYLCNEKVCSSIGNLADLNDECTEKRAELASKNITICNFTTLKENSMGIIRRVSTTIFGAIPKSVGDICRFVFNDNHSV